MTVMCQTSTTDDAAGKTVGQRRRGEDELLIISPIPKNRCLVPFWLSTPFANITSIRSEPLFHTTRPPFAAIMSHCSAPRPSQASRNPAPDPRVSHAVSSDEGYMESLYPYIPTARQIAQLPRALDTAEGLPAYLQMMSVVEPAWYVGCCKRAKVS